MISGAFDLWASRRDHSAWITFKLSQIVVQPQGIKFWSNINTALWSPLEAQRSKAPEIICEPAIFYGDQKKEIRRFLCSGAMLVQI